MGAIATTRTETTTPDAPATLVRGRGGWLWTVPRCPLCAKRHQHGGGHFDADPRAALGYRVGHCEMKNWRGAGPGGYWLVEATA